jgi:ribosomal protein L22
MSDETPEIEAEETASKRPRRRRRSKASASDAASSASAAPQASGDDATSEASGGAPATEESPVIDPQAEEKLAEEAAADVMLEAEAEAEGEDEPEAAAAPTPVMAAGEPEAPVGPAEPASEVPKPARRRRRGASEPAAETKAPQRPAPARRRARREQPAGPAPVVRAQAKYVRSSARKARLVCDNIRGKTVEEARAILAHTPRAVARDWSKLLESAVANAEHNHELVGEDLYVKAIHADEGPTVKRIQPRAMGRAYQIRKRTSHLTILLTPKG